MITIIWKCRTCGLCVRERVDNRLPNRALTEWLEAVATLAGERHELLRPECENDELFLAIPEPENEGDGVGITGKAFMPGWEPE